MQQELCHRNKCEKKLNGNYAEGVVVLKREKRFQNFFETSIQHFSKLKIVFHHFFSTKSEKQNLFFLIYRKENFFGFVNLI